MPDISKVKNDNGRLCAAAKDKHRRLNLLFSKVIITAEFAF